MKKSLSLMVLAVLLVSFVGIAVVNADSGNHKGFVAGTGHTNFPGQGLGNGHDTHECDPSCPICGGYPCVPPCPGVVSISPYGNGNLDEIRNYSQLEVLLLSIMTGWVWNNGISDEFTNSTPEHAPRLVKFVKLVPRR